MDKRKENKGTIGNKGGRPSVKDELKGVNLALPNVKKAFETIVSIMESVEENSRDRIAAAKLIIEYGCGKPKETIDQNLTINDFKVTDLVKFKSD